MAEALKRWNGTEWVPVASVNLITVSSGGGGLLSQPTHTAGWPPDVFPFNASFDTLTASDYVAVSHSYTIT